MRNLIEHPITLDEKIEAMEEAVLLSASIDGQGGGVGNPTLAALVAILEELKEEKNNEPSAG